MQSDRFVQAGYWLAAAAQDRRVAELLAPSEPNAACFHAQQSAEKSVKGALLVVADDIPRRHAITTLLDEFAGLGFAIDDEVLEAARTLDRYYAPTRYPDALGGVDPTRLFVEKDARDALTLLDRIIEFSDGIVAKERLSAERDLGVNDGSNEA